MKPFQKMTYADLKEISEEEKGIRIEEVQIKLNELCQVLQVFQMQPKILQG